MHHRDRSWVILQSVLMLAVVALGVTHRSTWQNTAVFGAGWIMFAIGAVLGIWGVLTLGAAFEAATASHRRPFPWE